MTGARTWTLRVPDARGLAAHAPAVLSVEEGRRAEGFRREEDRQRYVVAHVWLRELLGGLLGVAPAEVPIGAGACVRCGRAHGKPQLAAGTGLHFSLSHAGQIAMVATAASPVGVDVDVIPDDGTLSDLLGSLTAGERAALDAVPTAARAAAFTQCWVRKEAYLKATGEGLTRDPSHVEVGLGRRLAPDQPPAGFAIDDVDAPDGHAAAVCLDITGQPPP